jgi:hypothetical protein
MASTSSQEMATFDDYISNFRSELNNVAKTCLAGLEFKITEEGDGWLDAHLEAVFSSSSRYATSPVLAEVVDHVVLPLFNISKHHPKQLLSRRLGQSWKRRNKEPTKSRISMPNLL